MQSPFLWWKRVSSPYQRFVIYVQVYQVISQPVSNWSQHFAGRWSTPSHTHLVFHRLICTFCVYHMILKLVCPSDHSNQKRQHGSLWLPWDMLCHGHSTRGQTSFTTICLLYSVSSKSDFIHSNPLLMLKYNHYNITYWHSFFPLFFSSILLLLLFNFFFFKYVNIIRQFLPCVCW